jgi:hypothetical protein
MYKLPGTPEEQLITTIDIRELRQLRWPIMRLLTPHFVWEMELGRYLKGLMATHRWRSIRAVPHHEAYGPSHHVFDVYGYPAPGR